MRLGFTGSSLPWKRLLAEFAVIVAGVLIALAVNSWWERRQERNHAEQYLKQLHRHRLMNVERFQIPVHFQLDVFDTCF